MKLSPYTWSFAGRIVQQALSYASTIIMAHYLCPEDFGKVGVLAIFTTLASILADTGMGGSLIKEKNLTSKDCSTVFVYNLSLSVFLYIVLFFCSPLFERYFQIEGLTLISRLVTIPFVINALSIVPRSMCVKRLEFNRIFCVSSISTIIAMVVAWYMAWRGAGVWALVSYNIILALCDNIGYYAICRYRPVFLFSRSSFQKLFSFGLFTALSVIVDTIYENILSVLLGKNVGEKEVGYYTQAKKLEEAPSMSLSITVSNVAFPILSKLSDDNDVFAEQCSFIQNALLSITVPIMMVLYVFSKPIIVFLLGGQWVDAAPYLSILTLAGIMKVLENTNRTFIKSKGRADVIFWLAIFKRSIGIIILLISMKMGIKWLLYAYVFTSLLGALANTIALSKISEYHWSKQMKGWLKMALSGFVFFLILYVIKLGNFVWYFTVPLIILASVLYIGYLPLFGIKEPKLIIGKYVKLIKNKY